VRSFKSSDAYRKYFAFKFNVTIHNQKPEFDAKEKKCFVNAQAVTLHPKLQKVAQRNTVQALHPVRHHKCC